MGRRKEPLVTGGYYHVYNKSIAEFEIFRFRDEYVRMRETLCFYRTSSPRINYSTALKLVDGPESPKHHGAERVRLIAYCLMPTHFHLLVEQLAKNGVYELLKYLLGSYARYFNVKTRRKGPLWQSRFEARPVETDEDLLHMTRYIHLNPTSAELVKRPEDWEFSSYHEYLGVSKTPQYCKFKKNVSLTPDAYRKFAEDRIDYQRSLQIIKKHLLD
jgi:putative transposase